MSEGNLWNLNDRVGYYVFRNGNRKRYHRVGFVKAYRKTWLGRRYLVCVADKTREMDVVKPKQILGLAPKKEYKQSK